MKANLLLPHAWATLERQANRIFCSANPAARLTALREKLNGYFEELDGINDRAADDGTMKPADASRWDALMDEQSGLVASTKEELGVAEKRVAEMKRLALLKDAQNRSPDPFGQPAQDLAGYRTGGGDGRQGMRLKTADGKTHQALTSKDSLFAAAQARGGAGASGDDSDRFGSAEAAQNAFGESVLALVSGRPGGVRNVFTGNDDRGGFLMGDSLSSAIMDLARSQAVSFRAGAQTLDMQTPEVSIVSVASDPTAHWRAELQPVPSTDVTFSRHNLRANSVACIVPLSIEFAEDVANASAIVTSTVAASIALAIDRAILFGSGAANEPTGIVNTAGVNAVAGVDIPNDYGVVTQGIQKIYGANYAGEPGGLSWIMNPREAATYDSLIDSTAQPLVPTPWAGALQKYPTTSLPTDLGVGNDESEMIVGDFSNVLVGMRTNLNARILDAGRVSDENGGTIDAASQLAKLLVVYARLDVALVRPSWMTVLSGVKAA